MHDHELNDQDRELLKQIEEILAGQGYSQQESASLDSSPSALGAQLARSMPQADPVFQQRLEAQVIAKLRQREGTETFHSGIVGRLTNRFSQKPFKLSFAAALVLLLSLAAAWPVLGDTILQHVAPREVAQVPNHSHLVGPKPTGPRWADLDQLSKQAGFTVLIPNSLPEGCTADERWFIPGPQVVYLTYSCSIVISEQAAEGHQEQPYVGQGSTEKVTVNGQPALYIGGAWVQMAGQATPEWTDGVGQMLILERDGLIIHITSSQRFKDPSIVKAELIAIAESMQAAS